MEAFGSFLQKHTKTVYWVLRKYNTNSYYIGMTDKGIIKLTLAENFYDFSSFLKKSVPNLKLVQDSKKLADARNQLFEYLEGQRKTFDLPLDLHGTEFQQAVWDSRKRIPFGETRTYSQIAQDIGNEKAVRAVGAACGANRF